MMMFDEDLLGIALFVAFPLLQRFLIVRKRRLQTEDKTYSGSCHCEEVKFVVKAPRHLVAWDCNCSICYMKKNWHFIVPARNFHLISGEICRLAVLLPNS
ncbi:hypothetical protein EON65_31020 [archaeon]|nr:MAG: hypothetical protein EON65_31020 [archaeon]